MGDKKKQEPGSGGTAPPDLPPVEADELARVIKAVLHTKKPAPKPKPGDGQ